MAQFLKDKQNIKVQSGNGTGLLRWNIDKKKKKIEEKA